MWFRDGNLVKHKSGGPIMMVERAPPERLRNWGDWISCVWVEDGQRNVKLFYSGELQAVYADGTPRNYDDKD